MNNWVVDISLLPAKCGDCILIELDNGQNILIDAGFSQTYNQHLKMELNKLNMNGKAIDLFVVTHIDNDHISGAIKLLEENGPNRNNVITINEIWFNTFRHLIFTKLKANITNDQQKKKMLEISNSNQVFSKYVSDGFDEISTKDSISFERLILENGYLLNSHFDGDSIVYSDDVIQLKDIKIKILSPTLNSLKLLSDYWENELYMYFGKGYEISNETESIDFYNNVMANIDCINNIDIESISSINNFDFEQWEKEKRLTKCSIPNKSSIAMTMAYKNKTMLFLGDTEVDEDIVDCIISVYGKEHYFDAIKLSHHGSYSSNRLLINNIKAHNYLISTNGSKFGHPDKALILQILKEAHYKTLYFNYDLPFISLLNDPIKQKKYNFNVVYNSHIFL